MASQGKRIVITGASGFVGKSSVERFKILGYDVVCAGRNKSDEIYCDLSDPKTCLSINDISDIDGIVHLGARVGFDGSSLDQLFAPNILSTAIIANIAFNQNALLVFASAAIVNGIKSELISVNSPLNPDTPYAQSKALAEECVRASGAQSAILRIGGVYGIKGPKHLGLNRSIEDAMHGTAPAIFGDGSGKRNYVFVDDLAKIIVNTVRDCRVGTHVVAGSEILSISEMIHSICDVFSIESGPVWHAGNSSRSQVLSSSSDFTGESFFGNSLELIKRRMLLA